jgi:uncharacterized membrane protein (UPF0127 family)
VSRARLVARNASRGTLLAESLEDGSSLWAKFMGLMFRSRLPRGHGLWLPGENGIHMLFMRFAIDVVFVAPPPGRSRSVPGLGRLLGGTGSGGRGGGEGGDGGGGGVEGAEGPRKVLALRRALPPWRGVVWRVGGAKGVLELPAGAIDESGTQLGDEIVIERPT